jgi:hypothetical protein
MRGRRFTIAKALRMNERWVWRSSSFIFEVSAFGNTGEEGKEEVCGGWGFMVLRLWRGENWKIDLM